MTAYDGYVWFLPSWFTPQWWMTDQFNALGGEHISCTREQMMKAIYGYFFLNTASLGPGNSQIVGNLTVNEWLKEYVYRLTASVRFRIAYLIILAYSSLAGSLGYFVVWASVLLG